MRLSEDHKPNSREERSRIERAGGCVVNFNGIWRVCTAGAAAGLKLVDDDSLFLSTSRAFGNLLRLFHDCYHHCDATINLYVWLLCSGDRKLKIGNLVSAIPEVTAHRLHWGDLFFVLACDGVWDVLSDQEVIEIAAQKLFVILSCVLLICVSI